jgi:uncharacterized membrane protein YkoI
MMMMMMAEVTTMTTRRRSLWLAGALIVLVAVVAAAILVAGRDASAGRSGALDDGAELLPKARITLDEAINAARAAAPGDVGEVDLEYWRGRLVYNVDVGDKDVKVDAETGALLGAIDEGEDED